MEHFLSFDTIDSKEIIGTPRQIKSKGKNIILNFKLTCIVSTLFAMILFALIISLILVSNSKKSLSFTITNLSNEVDELKEKLIASKSESDTLFNDNLRLQSELISLQREESELQKTIERLSSKLEEVTIQKVGNALTFPNSNILQINSKIVTTYREKDFLHKITAKRGSYLNLLYRASEDGDNHFQFHKKVDRATKTLTIIKTTLGHKFGGYTEESWSCEGVESMKIKKDENAFVFSFMNENAYRIQNAEMAIECGQDSLVKFNKDLVISTECLSNSKSCSFFPSGYNFDNLTAGKNELTQGEILFRVKELEVFEVQERAN